MKTLLRRLRGALGVAVTWAIGWGVVMFVIGTVISIVDPPSIDPGEEPWRLALIVAPVGAISGAVFALVFAVAERHRRLHDLSGWRAAAWGAIGGAALPLLTPMNNSIVYNTAVLGALFAGTTVAIVRRAALRAPDRKAKLPPATQA